ncbi:Ubiquitin-activating enzyme E1 2 -like protein [Gossypium arboreum]|uniref:Ubiquitin-activating enzyme E1 2-like protein n=2 Tax=Gossypium arboreum TaxID=29729 RepID=A0A0B0NYT7_GOSAR|nr:Ubiquitin-activating enzyme E1 2 -like protein [Gossypium arboreum]
MSQTWSYTDFHISRSTPCPKQVLHWLSSIGVDAMSQTGLTLTHNKLTPCPRQVLH